MLMIEITGRPLPSLLSLARAEIAFRAKRLALEDRKEEINGFYYQQPLRADSHRAAGHIARARLLAYYHSHTTPAFEDIGLDADA